MAHTSAHTLGDTSGAHKASLQVILEGSIPEESTVPAPTIVRAATKKITPRRITFIARLESPGDVTASEGGFGCSKSSGKATTATTERATPEAYKSPGPPKLAIKSYMLGSYMLGPCS